MNGDKGGKESGKKSGVESGEEWRERRTVQVESSLQGAGQWGWACGVGSDCKESIILTLFACHEWMCTQVRGSLLDGG